MFNKLFLFDNTMGYKFGNIMWLVFFLPSLGVLLGDSTTGPGRDYLAFGTLMSVLNYMVYGYYLMEGRPASTPSQVGILAEALGRWTLAAYYGPANIVGWSAIGVMNFILLLVSAIFGVMKMVAQFMVNFDVKGYLTYEREHLVTVD